MLSMYCDYVPKYIIHVLAKCACNWFCRVHCEVVSMLSMYLNMCQNTMYMLACLLVPGSGGFVAGLWHASVLGPALLPNHSAWFPRM